MTMSATASAVEALAEPMTAEAEPLLRIDFAAALGKLTQAQLQGTWQLPTEAVRLMIAAGAKSVRLEITASNWSVVAPGASLSRQVLADFASILDTELDDAQRHRALVDLEARDAFILAALGCLDIAALSLRTGRGRGTGIEKANDLLSVERPQEAGRADVELRVGGLALDAARAIDWLRRSARFAPIEIVLAGRVLPRGFQDAISYGTASILPKPSSRDALSGERAVLPAALAIPRRGKSPRLWLLRHGVISTRATVPLYPCFEAAIEMAPTSEPQATGAALREALGRHVDPLVDEAVALMIREAGKLQLDDPRRERLARLLLEAAALDRAVEEIAGVRLFPCWTALSGAPTRRLVSLAEIRRLLHLEEEDETLGEVAVHAIAPGDDPRRFALEGRVVLVLSSEERSVLGEMLGAIFAPPPPRLRESAWERLRRVVRQRLSRASARIGRPLDEEDLADDEKNLARRVRVALSRGGEAPTILFTDGDAPPQRRADGVLVLPRRHEDVRRSARVLMKDADWLYPVLLAILGGEELPPAFPFPEDSVKI